MSAVFGTPVAATLFGVELLAFEFRPRSMVLIGLAAATADGLRMVMASAGPGLTPADSSRSRITPRSAAWSCSGPPPSASPRGLGAWVMTQAVYRFEDLFKKLTGHLHWMWWPMIGGVLIGVGGLIDPRALGVGYDTIHAELLGQLAVGALLLLLVVKLVIWSGALGSGTSGGILAPIMMMGAAIGGILGHVCPARRPGYGHCSGSPGRWRASPAPPLPPSSSPSSSPMTKTACSPCWWSPRSPIWSACWCLKRSILTEKVARRGFHVMREYAVDPLEATFVREVMDTDIYTVEPDSIARRPLSIPPGRLDASAANAFTQCSTTAPV